MEHAFRHLRQEWFIAAEMVVLGLFAAGDASGSFRTLFGIEPGAEWVFVASIIIIGLTALIRLGSLRERIAQHERGVRLTAKLGALSANMPDPGPDKTSLTVHVFWNVWTNQDVATDRLALNLIYLYDRSWWQFWKRTRFPQTGIPAKGRETTEYRTRIYANENMPHQDDAVFEYVGDRGSGNEGPHWILELVLITGVPVGEHRIPVFIDRDELRSRGTNPPL